MSLQIFLLFLLLVHQGTGFESRPIVNTPDGSIQASILESHQGVEFYGFQSIPYASPPLGNLRWLPPHPSPGWNGTLDGSASPVLCVQSVPDTEMPAGLELQAGPAFIVGQEDCLILNVYSPELEPSQLLPVMVWFHGGGFSSGEAGLYGAHFFMDYQVVIVTVNYRLGPWGFLSLDTASVSGNQGLRDQVMALEWIKNNIQYFGGDGDQVTIFGESAGGWSICHHILSPPSSSLFQAAIGQSGTISGLAETSFSREEAALNGQHFASALDCYQEGSPWDGQDVEMCMREKTTEELHSVHITGTFRSRGNVDNFSSHPPILPDSPDTLLSLGLFNKVPVMIGSNSGEGIINSGKFIKEPDLMDEQLDDPNFWDNQQGPFYIFDRIPGLNMTDYGPCDVEIAKAARQFYFNGTINKDKLKQFINLNTDSHVWYGTHRTINYLSPHIRVYHYILSFQDLKSFTANYHVIGTDLGVCHADDLPYLWDFFGINSATGLYDFWWNEQNKRNSRRMLELWSNFAKHLDPTPQDGSSDLEGVIWDPVTEEHHRYLNIDTDLTMDMSQEYLERMHFWKSVLESCKT